MKKICPTCKRLYSEISNYCTKCGIELEKEPNKCTGNKTALCKNAIFEDDDKFCSFCGSPTTYWKESFDEMKQW